MSHEMSTASTAHTERGYSASYTVEQSPDEVFAAILDVGAWGSVEIRPTAVYFSDGQWIRAT